MHYKTVVDNINIKNLLNIFIITIKIKITKKI